VGEDQDPLKFPLFPNVRLDYHEVGGPIAREKFGRCMGYKYRRGKGLELGAKKAKT
jgi:hypothetical protein